MAQRAQSPRPLSRSTAAPKLKALLLLSLAAGAGMAQSGSITVSDSGAAGPATCTLAQAIWAANIANFPNTVPASQMGSATTGKGNCSGETTGSNTIVFASALAGQSLSYGAADNWWYGPNALPPIASTMSSMAAPAASRCKTPTPRGCAFSTSARATVWARSPTAAPRCSPTRAAWAT